MGFVNNIYGFRIGLRLKCAGQYEPKLHSFINFYGISQPAYFVPLRFLPLGVTRKDRYRPCSCISYCGFAF
jgi:hypothetical protein